LYGYDAQEEVDAVVKMQPFESAASITTTEAAAAVTTHETKMIPDVSTSRNRFKAVLALRKLVSWLRH
jgi:hypothetical protein